MLFDKDGFYDLSLPDVFEVSIKNDNSEYVKLFDKKEALRKGNTFKNLYDQYKNYTPREIKSSTKEEEMLNKIRCLAFSINDLNLYLDLNPDDSVIYEIFKENMMKLKKIEKEYSEIYGSLKLEDLTPSYGWLKSNFPWEVKNV